MRSARYTRPNIWPRPCFIWERRARGDLRARPLGVADAASLLNQLAGKPYAVNPKNPVACRSPGRPGTRKGSSRFHAARYCKETLDLDPVFIAGPGEDLTLFREYRSVAGAPLGEIKSLLRGAAMFLGNDSGPAHMAAAFGIPVVVVFGSSDAAIWHPWRTASEVVQGAAGIQSIPDRQVLDALERLRVPA